MLREVLIGEGMHALGIPTTRALAVAATGEPVWRDKELPGAVLARVAASHLRVGTFQFSFERGTASEPLGDPIPPEVKEERYDRLMTLQQGISLERNQAWVGRTLNVLIEGQGQGFSLGRSYRDAPEIDGLVIVEGQHPTGAMLPVRINGAMAYDLSGLVALE